MPVCNGMFLEYKDNFSITDAQVKQGLAAHRDPEFWKDYEKPELIAMRAALKRYACYLRREARRRGLL